jgi:hypothetical protein
VCGGERGRPLDVAIATSPALEHRPAAALYASCAVDSSRAGWCAVRDVGNGPRARRPHGPCRCRTVVGVADRRGAG